MILVSKIDERLDLNGRVCPMPAALVRKSLKRMESGQILEATGDFDPALENVILMAEKNGGTVLEKEVAENYYRIVIKKTE